MTAAPLTASSGAAVARAAQAGKKSQDDRDGAHLRATGGQVPNLPAGSPTDG
ncbi:hypothetical protein GCM10010201_36200 [Pilimelia columellifera subsp. columellifera]|uniref:SMP domain-containing protein n=1 Tax=Pilimelia columellifera subsp. columellifera TaxID=706583 RepID=A0ABP6B2E7_9ACTN